MRHAAVVLAIATATSCTADIETTSEPVAIPSVQPSDPASSTWQVAGFGWRTGWCFVDSDSTCAASAIVSGEGLVLETGSGTGVREFAVSLTLSGRRALRKLAALASAGKPPTGCGVCVDGRDVSLSLVKRSEERQLTWDPATARDERDRAIA